MDPRFKDPFWREALQSIGWRFADFGLSLVAPSGPITWRGKLGWKLHAIGDFFTDLGVSGSNFEALLYLEGDIPWECAAPELRRRLYRDFPDYFEDEEGSPVSAD